jgi:HAD superfamily hydrolase (TIGR01509 family)
MIRGLIFDFDGLILDTEGPVHTSWVELFQNHGTELPFDDWAAIIGTSTIQHFDPFNMLEDKIGHSLDRKTLALQRHAREMELCEAQPILPGVIEMIQAAQGAGFKLGVASSSDREWVVGNLTRLGLVHYFESIHTSEDVELTKPDPALFQLTLRSLDFQPDEAIVFEDSPNGVTAAKTAGIYVVVVPNPLTSLLPLDHADLRLNSLADITLEELLALVDQTR